MNAILILIGLMTVVIIAYIILFEIQIKHIKEQLEYFERSRGQLFNEIQRIWDKIHDIKWVEIEPIKEQISELEQHASVLKPIPIVKEESRPIKRLECVHFLNDFPNFEQYPDLMKRKIAEQLYTELKNYIVFEWTEDKGVKALRGSIDIVGRI